MQSLKDNISKHYFLDRLLDFNNQTQMTATETIKRDSIRNTSLSAAIDRMTFELFSPLINRSFNILLKNDMFEDMPESMTEAIDEGEDVYEIKYITPAARQQQRTVKF